jgi:hypothetical protein
MISPIDNSSARDRALRQAQANQAARLDPNFDSWMTRVAEKAAFEIQTFLATIPSDDPSDPRGE